jgi:hypothetical protein
MKGTKHLIIVVILCTVTYGQLSRPRLIAKFTGGVDNDTLAAYMDLFHSERIKTGTPGYVVLRGSNWAKLRNYRRVTGCLRWRNVSSQEVMYVFAETQPVTEVEFWLVPNGIGSENFHPSEPDYRLDDLNEPVEVSVSQATDEYCPIAFDLEYFSRFLKANPYFSGKAVIDSPKKNFVPRVLRYRTKLSKLGISPDRVRYVRRHFAGERDERWWLIPSKRR